MKMKKARASFLSRATNSRDEEEDEYYEYMFRDVSTYKDRVPMNEEQAPTAFAHWHVKWLDISPYVLFLLWYKRIESVEQLVGRLGNLTRDDLVIEEINYALRRHAAELPAYVSDAGAAELARTSGSDTYVFDALGMLCLLEREGSGRASSGYPAHVTTVIDAQLPYALQNGLIKSGRETLEQASLVRDEELLQMRGVGPTAVQKLRECAAEADESLRRSTALATKGARLAFDMLTKRGYLLYATSFFACMTLVALEEAGLDRDPFEYRDAVIHAVEESRDLGYARTEALIVKAEEQLGEIWLEPCSVTIDVPEGDEWDEPARVVSRDPRIDLDEERRVLILHHLSLWEWLCTCPESVDLFITRQVLAGVAMKDVGNEFGMDSIQVCTLASDLLKEAPVLVEDRYRYFHTRYGLTNRLFCEITGEPEATYLYLLLSQKMSPRTTLELKHAISDPDVPKNTRERVLAFLGGAYCVVCGVKTLRTRKDILMRLVEQRASGVGISISDLYDAYEGTLVEIGAKPSENLSFPNVNALRTYANRYCPTVMVLPKRSERKSGVSVRHYDVANWDLEPLKAELSAGYLGTGRRSAHELFEDERLSKALAKAGIRNGYELHYVLAKRCGDIAGVKCLMSPTVELGV